MATIGQSLKAPEAGWKRYDDSDIAFRFTAFTQQNYSDSSAYQGKTSYNANGSNAGEINFIFKGTKLRIISTTTRPERANSISISVDGQVETFTARTGTAQGQTLVYEKTGLNDMLHSVRIFNLNGAVSGYAAFGLDAVDIDDTGFIMELFNKFLIRLGDDEVVSIVNGSYSENAIPSMTSNTSSIGSALYSSIYSTTYDAWKAFDNYYDTTSTSTDTNGWITANGVITGYLGFSFIESKYIGKYKIYPRSTTLNTNPKDWTFEGSNDGENWNLLDTQTNITWSAGIGQEFIIQNPQTYNQYRINITANNGGGYTSIQELQMFGLPFIKYVSQTEQNFINHGMDKQSIVNLNQSISKRAYVVEDNDSLGSGKVFRRIINTSKVPIKNVSMN